MITSKLKKNDIINNKYKNYKIEKAYNKNKCYKKSIIYNNLRRIKNKEENIRLLVRIRKPEY